LLLGELYSIWGVSLESSVLPRLLSFLAPISVRFLTRFTRRRVLLTTSGPFPFLVSPFRCYRRLKSFPRSPLFCYPLSYETHSDARESFLHGPFLFSYSESLHPVCPNKNCLNPFAIFFSFATSSVPADKSTFPSVLASPVETAFPCSSDEILLHPNCEGIEFRG